jgi:hypothetical protein
MSDARFDLEQELSTPDRVQDRGFEVSLYRFVLLAYRIGDDVADAFNYS